MQHYGTTLEGTEPVFRFIRSGLHPFNDNPTNKEQREGQLQHDNIKLRLPLLWSNWAQDLLLSGTTRLQYNGSSVSQRGSLEELGG